MIGGRDAAEGGLAVGKSTLTIGRATTEITAPAITVNTPMRRSPVSTSVRTAAVSSAAACADIRVNIAVSRETVTSECGSMKIRNALL